MFPLFRRKAAPATPTFNERVDAFWKWFREVAPRFSATIEDKRCAALSEETSAKIDELFPGFAWVFGPGPEGKGHSFTLSGEGNEHRQLLALQWQARAPTITGWTFYASRQAGPISGQVIEIDGLRFDPREIWVTTEVDREQETINVTVWHPSWERIGEEKRRTVVFLYLDEALGEYGTERWIGQIHFGRDRLRESFPLEELAGKVGAAVQANGWKSFPPGESYTVFRVKVTDGGFSRGDVVAQTTAVPRLFREYMDAAGELEDPLRGTGADYVYVSIDRGFFPHGDETAKRGQIEDAIECPLKAAGAGRCIGGALGTERAYVDLLLFDGTRSLAIVREALQSAGVPAGTMIEFFAREMRARRIAL